MSKPEHISVCDGKYTVVIDGGKLTALRHGEPWQDLCGNNLVYWLAAELQRTREALIDLDEAARKVQAGEMDVQSIQVERNRAREVLPR